MNDLETMTEWIEVNKQLKNIENRLQIYPTNELFLTEKQRLTKREAKLRLLVDTIKSRTNGATFND